MVIFVDIDETICHNNPKLEYGSSIPNIKAIAKINALYDAGNEIIYWTARGTVSGKNWFHRTQEQLKKWGVKYHELRMGKPAYDLFICDKTKRIEEI